MQRPESTAKSVESYYGKRFDSRRSTKEELMPISKQWNSKLRDSIAELPENWIEKLTVTSEMSNEQIAEEAEE
jgi:hypothetical protein